MASKGLPPNIEYVPNSAPAGPLTSASVQPAGQKAPWWTPKRKAIVFLMFMSAAIAELVSGSSPPLEFFNPFMFTLLFLFYGCGAVLVRETAIRWNKGFATILLLGAAFGILEEGLAVKSWLDPNWMDLGTLGWYGRFWGVNWVWAVWLTVYHSVCSITIPIIITDMVFPQFKGVRITDDEGWKSYKGFFLLGSLVYLFSFLFITPYRPPVPQFLVVAGLMVMAIWIAYIVPVPLLRATPGRPTWSPRRFFLLGAFFLFFTFFSAGSALSAVPRVRVIIFCATDLVVLFLLLRHIGTEANGRHLVAFMAGCESLFLFIGFIFEFFNHGFLGMSAVSVGAAIFFVWLYKRMEKVDLGVSIVAPAVPLPSAVTPAAVKA
jgi:hypothetical protein